MKIKARKRTCFSLSELICLVNARAVDSLNSKGVVELDLKDQISLPSKQIQVTILSTNANRVFIRNRKLRGNVVLKALHIEIYNITEEIVGLGVRRGWFLRAKLNLCSYLWGRK